MKIIDKYYTQNGLTLIEVLAAMVILGIVFIGIMTVFPQMTLFNEKTETKLDTMNLAREEMAKLTSSTYDEADFMDLSQKFKTILNTKEDGSNIYSPNPYTVTKENTNVEYVIYSVVNSKTDFPYTIHVYRNKDLNGTISLYKVILQIKTSSTSPNSETFGYLETTGGATTP
jgi:prepilin-type N-terminal cleavage/methylation domain-containing protein